MTEESYFENLSTALVVADIHQPCLILDLDRLDRNIASVKTKFPSGKQLRIVDKSLPSLELLERIARAFDTSLFMSFHLPIAAAVLERFPGSRIVLGKPMPVAGARRALTNGVLADRSMSSRVVWLIDTVDRIASYGALSEDLGIDLEFCFEVDVGLHRGGLPDATALQRALKVVERYPRLQCRGMMAYEAHIGHIPKLFGGPKKALATTKRRFAEYLACLGPRERQIVNLGGSSTALSYDDTVNANELSMGSAFVLPSDFDVPTLSALEPAAFIATPILKVVDARLPGLDDRSWIVQRLGRFPRRGAFIYGGKWMAKPVHPTGMKTSTVMGSSTNQQFMELPDDSQVKADDYAFLRPTQSEFVFQQFGPIAVYSHGNIVGYWPVLGP